MARTAISRTAIPADTGLNLTDATFQTLGTGAGNGVEIPYRKGDVIVLKNDTGGAAVFTIKVPTPANLDEVGVTAPDITVNVANGKTVLFAEAIVLRQADGDIYVDCDVAGKVLALATADIEA